MPKPRGIPLQIKDKAHFTIFGHLDLETVAAADHRLRRQ